MKLAPEAGLKVGLNSDVIQFTGNRKNVSGSNGHTIKIIISLFSHDQSHIYIYSVQQAGWNGVNGVWVKVKLLKKKGGWGEFAGVTSNITVSDSRF